MNHNFIKSIAALLLYLVCLPTWTQTEGSMAKKTTRGSEPLFWDGPRDKSCDVYHSSKYTKPLYDIKTIDEHLTSVLGVDKTPKLFYRWERPVRYYLEVPSEYPQLAKQFEAQVAQIAKYTGLDIARHDKPYFEYKDSNLNDKSKWPDGLSTNVVFVITTDIEKTVHEPLINQLLMGFEVTPDKALADWNYVKKINNNSLDHSSYRYGYDSDGMKFSLVLLDPREFIKSKNFKTLKNSFSQTIFGVVSVIYNTKDKLFEPNSSDISEINQQLLRVLYSKKYVRSGMWLVAAKRLMAQELIDCFNAKGK